MSQDLEKLVRMKQRASDHAAKADIGRQMRRRTARWSEVSGVGPGMSARGWNFGIGLPAGWSWEHLVLAVVLLGAVAWWFLLLCGSCVFTG